MHEEFEALSKVVEFRDLRLTQRPCDRCNQLSMVKAEYFAQSRKLVAFCPCGARLELDQKFYSAFLKKRKRRLEFEFSSAEPAIRVYERCGFRCVYHEASREAEEFRLRQVDAIRSRFPSSQPSLVFQEPEIQATLLGNDRQVEIAARNLFGLEVDHLYPRWVSLALRPYLESDEWERCARHWVVAACAACNQDRATRLESGPALLYVYSRFVMPFAGDGVQQARDVLAFSAVLEKIERLGIRLADDQREAR
jgi:transcription elongation factor Elf1